MLWFFFALCAVFLWACSDLLTKHLLEKYVRQPLVFIIITGLLSLIIAPLLLSYTGGVPQLEWFDFLVLMLAGFSSALLLFFQYQALKLEEASRIIPLLELKGLFVPFLAFAFLGERLSSVQYTGILLLVLGAFFLSVRKDFGLRNPKALSLILLGVFSLSMSRVLLKYALGFTASLSAFAFFEISYILFAFPFAFVYFNELKNTISTHGWRVFALMVCADLLGAAGMLLMIFALSLGPVSLVSGIGATEPFFILVFALALSFFAPSFLKEEIDAKTIAIKTFAVVLLLTGAFLTL